MLENYLRVEYNSDLQWNTVDWDQRSQSVVGVGYVTLAQQPSPPLICIVNKPMLGM